ncbi:acyl-CoA carboxylase subunit epsilon [Nocardia veterana]|uniref:Acyl-CoA carboxylase subunit epsilon n=1 Tax=Nocardia veterana TaxID=132249 RepID=A0A7X6LXN3_9NOCA|nr:acyl-CoA carboxylase subunit epsilon [Nocardia veterana]NKY86432.1 acyl-CoA carboxylase subunit epsilon [Nocardia veterana]
MTAVADEEILRAAELDLAVDGFEDDAKVAETVAPEAEPHGGPVIRILKGSPTDEELAALVTVFAAAAANSGAPQEQGPVDNWGRPTMMHRGTSPFSPYTFPYLSHIRG